MRSLAPLGMTVVDLARPIAASAVATTRANADRATTIEGKNGKGVRPGDERLSKLASVLLTHQAALHRSFTVCSRPLVAQACSLQAGRLLFGFARLAL